MPDKPIKRGRGRPSLTGKPGERFMIRLPQHVADYLRKLGAGSISRGIIHQTVGGPAPVARAVRAPKRLAKA